MANREYVTIQRVAKAAGVSIATVSRVLAGLPGAGEETRKRVLRTADELGYRSDPNAKALRSRKSGAYGMVVPDLRNPFFPELIHSVEDHAQRKGIELFIANAQNDTEAERHRVETLIRRRVDALFISPVDRLESASTVRWASARVPVFQLDRRAGDSAPYVGADQAFAITKIVEHLLNAGRKRIAYVGFPDSSSTSKERIDAFQQLMATDPDFDPHIETGMPAPAAQEIADLIETNSNRLDAIIASSDLHGITTKFELQRRHIRVPEDIAMVSFDNTFIAAAADMTSMQQPVDLIAERTIDLIENDDVTDETIILAGYIVIRGSSAT